MCSGSEAGSYLRLIDSVYHSTLGVRVIKKRKRRRRADIASCAAMNPTRATWCRVCGTWLGFEVWGLGLRVSWF